MSKNLRVSEGILRVSEGILRVSEGILRVSELRVPRYNSASWPMDSHIVRAGVRFRQPRRVAAMKRANAVLVVKPEGKAAEL